MTKIYPIYVESCGECPNCRVTGFEYDSIRDYYCLALGKNKKIFNNRVDGTIHSDCPLKDR